MCLLSPGCQGSPRDHHGGQEATESRPKYVPKYVSWGVLGVSARMLIIILKK